MYLFKKKNFDFVPLDYQTFSNEYDKLVVAVEDQKVHSFLDHNHSVNQFEGKFVSLSIHSLCLFAVSSSTGIHFFFNTRNTFVLLFSQKRENPVITFVPSRVPFLLVHQQFNLFFYTLNRDSIKQITEPKPVPSISSFSLNKDFIFAFSFSLILHLKIDQKYFPHSFLPSSDYVFLTSLSLGIFSVVSERLSNQVPSSFLIRTDPETVPFSKISYPHLPKCFSTFCQLLPEGWHRTDIFGYRYLFSFILVQCHPEIRDVLSLFAVWGLISRSQYFLVQSLPFNSLTILLESLFPIWVNDQNLLKGTVQKVLKLATPTESEFDTFILLCSLVGLRKLGAVIAKKNNQTKLSDFLNSNKTKGVEKSAFVALQNHRPILAAMFFIQIKKVDQALKVIQDDKILSILVARLLNVSYNLEKYSEFQRWRSGDKSSLIHFVKSFQFPQGTFNFEAHRILILIQLGCSDDTFFMNILDLPFFISFCVKDALLVRSTSFQEMKPSNSSSSEQLYNDPEVNEVEKSNNTKKFDFGVAYEDDEFDVEEDTGSDFEEEQPITQIPSKYLETLSTFSDAEFSSTFFFNSEQYTLGAITRILTISPSENDLENLIKIVEMSSSDESKVGYVFSILFSIAFYLSAASLVSNLFTLPINDSGIHLIPQIQISSPSKIDFCAALGFFDASSQDIILSNFLIFDNFTRVVSSKNSQNAVPILSFFHHYHRLMFSKITHFEFKDPEISENLVMLLPNLNSNEISNNIAQMTQKELKQFISISSFFPHLSPFIRGSSFFFSRDEKMSTKLQERCTSLCINQKNNSTLAVVSNNVHELSLFSPHTEVSESEFDSPLVSLMNTSASFNSFPSFGRKRKLNCTWGKLRQKKICPISITSHPKEELFVTGDEKGHLLLWNFGFSEPLGGIQIPSVKKLSFNSCGNRLLCHCQDNQLVITDFISSNLYFAQPFSSIEWLNSDTQVIVTQPSRPRLSIIDLLSGTDPVANIPYQKDPSQHSPLAVSGSSVVVGHDDGGVSIFDIRAGSAIKSIFFHTDEITCIRYDNSGSFFVNGSKDNSISFVDALFYGTLSVFNDVLPPIQPNKKGILDIALSSHTIAICGNSHKIQTWSI